MTTSPSKYLTGLLLTLPSSDDSDRSTADKIFEIVYDELRLLASNLMRHERIDHTLQPTALVHEAYCRLVDQTRIEWHSRAHFYGIASRAMRQILVDHARRHSAEKRGGDRQRVTLDERLGIGVRPNVEILELDEVLKKLAEMDPRMARVVELRTFGGLTGDEIAHVLGITRRTVQEDWRVARMWLNRKLSGESDP